MKHRKPVILSSVATAVLLVGLLGLAATTSAEEYILKDGKWVAAPKPVKGTVSGELAVIRQKLKARDYKGARDEADLFCKARPDSPACEEAMLLGAQAEIERGMYYQAFERLQDMIARYPNGTFLERALTREMECAEAFLAGKKRIIGGGMLRLPATDEGLTILRKVFEHAPGTDIAERAILRIGDYHYGQKDYRDAVDAYDEFLALHPRSTRAATVMAKAAAAMYESFKGVAYDETPLVEAENRYKAMIEQYPDEARKAKAPDVLREIVTIRAERAFETAKFYERTKRPKSAQFYYRKIVEEFPATAWASEARTRIAPKKRRVPAVRPKTTPTSKKPAVTPKTAPPTGKPPVKPTAKTATNRPDPATGKPLPIELPTVYSGTLETTVTCPDGGTLVLPGESAKADAKTKAPEGGTKLVPDRRAKAEALRKPAAPSRVTTTTAPAAKDPDDSLLEDLLESQDEPTTQPAAGKPADDESKGTSK